MKRKVANRKMRKADQKLCRSCKYGTVLSSGTRVVCDYYGKTGQRRECPVGSCDKYEKKQKK